MEESSIPATNINGLTSDQIAEAISSHVKDLDLSRLDQISFSIHDEGISVQATYLNQLNSLAIRGLTV